MVGIVEDEMICGYVRGERGLIIIIITIIIIIIVTT